MVKKQVINFLAKNFKGNVEGKTIIITGGNSGIGFEASRMCAYLKMNVIIAARSIERGVKAVESIQKEFPESSISFMKVDMSEEESVKNFVEEIIDKKIDVDVFYHNAGIFRIPYQLKENRELTISTNFYGPLMVNSLLNPYLHSLKHEVKMIITGSVAVRWSKITNDILEPSPKLSRMRRYSNSKLMDSFLFKYLFDNDKDSNIRYYMVHPGVCYTPLFKKTYKKLFGEIVDLVMHIFANPAWKSALAAASAISEDAVEGEFYGPTCMFNSVGYPHKNRFMNKRYGREKELIEKSEEIVGYHLLAKNK
ncbi:MAG: SDR family NAD(P)-dependent oxidoreductase [Bacilli bacterium]|nr:SDR family NAD(P)-dependent oxidoreductase [Bacilli bacterium]